MKITGKNLTKYYQNQLIIKDIDFELKEGLVYGVTGDNGTGKTTLFRIISGIEKQSCGQVFYDGSKINKTHIKRMTYMHQKPYMMRTSVIKNIMYPLSIRKKITDEDLALSRRLMEELKIYRFKDKKAWELSGGEMQKVAFARALIFKPEVLLMDEPTAHIDKKSMETVHKLIKERQDEGLTTAVITHDFDQLSSVFNQVIHLENNRLYYI